jgi:hypothetical protein
MEKGLYRPCGGNESEWVDYFLPIPLVQILSSPRDFQKGKTQGEYRKFELKYDDFAPHFT